MSSLNFITPVPGLGNHAAFMLEPVQGVAGLFSMVADGDAGLRLFVLEAAVFLPDYNPTLSDDQCRALQLQAPQDARVLVVANPSGGKTTVNLLAPIVVNINSGRCAQIILDGQGWPLRAELSAA